MKITRTGDTGENRKMEEKSWFFEEMSKINRLS